MAEVMTYFPDDEPTESLKSGYSYLDPDFSRAQAEWLEWYDGYRQAIHRGERPEYRTLDSFAK